LRYIIPFEKAVREKQKGNRKHDLVQTVRPKKKILKKKGGRGSCWRRRDLIKETTPQKTMEE